MSKSCKNQRNFLNYSESGEREREGGERERERGERERERGEREREKKKGRDK
jgi:hypothetical protein